MAREFALQTLQEDEEVFILHPLGKQQQKNAVKFAVKMYRQYFDHIVCISILFPLTCLLSRLIGKCIRSERLANAPVS